jgi:ribosomal protein L32
MTAQQIAGARTPVMVTERTFCPAVRVAVNKNGLWSGCCLASSASFWRWNHSSLERRDEKRKLAQVRVGTLRQCPFCGEFIRPEASVRRYCGRDIARAPQA